MADATNASPAHREELLRLGYGYGCPPIAVVFNIPLAACLNRNVRRRVPAPFLRDTDARIRRGAAGRQG
ncbi:AAA family ATPase [Micromonospora sp. CPCC 205554]|uniref:AAA family ATPase n=1 Tax=unclassified Micromonospora TaxID=2617518 RepID=UPI003FA53BB9